MANITCISTVQHIKMADGSFAAIFPVTTTKEVYFDIDAGITLEQYNSAIYGDSDYEVETHQDLLNFLTENTNVLNGSTVYVKETNKKYIVLDNTKLNAEDAFKEIPNAESGSVEPEANRAAKYDEDGKLHSAMAESGNEVITYDFLDTKNFTLGVTAATSVEEVEVSNAALLGGIPADQYVTVSQLRLIAEIEDTTPVAIKAEKLCDTIAIERLPAGAIQKCVTVNSDDERFKLTTATVHNGDTIKVKNTLKMYFITDETKLTSELGYTEYTVGTAGTVAWAGISGRPTTLAGYGIDTDEGSVKVSEVETENVGRMRFIQKDDINGTNVTVKEVATNTLEVTTTNAGAFTVFSAGKKLYNLNIKLTTNDSTSTSYILINDEQYDGGTDNTLHVNPNTDEPITLTKPITIYIGNSTGGTVRFMDTILTGELTLDTVTDKTSGFISSEMAEKLHLSPGTSNINKKSDIFNDENNTAEGFYSHSGGVDSHANAYASFTHGVSVTSEHDNQTVFGKYNDTESDALFIVGAGKDGDNRKNAIEIGEENTVVEKKISTKADLTLDDLNDNDFVTKKCIQNIPIGYIMKPDINKMSWKEIQNIVRMGIAPDIFKIGDQLTVNYNGNDVQYEIVGFDVETPSDKTLTHSMTLTAVDPIDIMPAAANRFIFRVADGKTIPAGTYYTSQFSIMETVRTISNYAPVYFEITEPIPSGYFITVEDEHASDDSNSFECVLGIYESVSSNNPLYTITTKYNPFDQYEEIEDQHIANAWGVAGLVEVADTFYYPAFRPNLDDFIMREIGGWHNWDIRRFLNGYSADYNPAWSTPDKFKKPLKGKTESEDIPFTNKIDSELLDVIGAIDIASTYTSPDDNYTMMSKIVSDKVFLLNPFNYKDIYKNGYYLYRNGISYNEILVSISGGFLQYGNGNGRRVVNNILEYGYSLNGSAPDSTINNNGDVHACTPMYIFPTFCII